MRCAWRSCWYRWRRHREWIRSRSDFPLDATHVIIAAGLVIFPEADLHECGVHGGVAGIDGGEIGSGSDIGDDHAEVFRRDHPADQVLHFGDFVIRNREPGAAWGLQIDDELTGVRSGRSERARGG